MVRLPVEHRPGEREAKPLWLCSSATGIDTAHGDRIRRTFLSGFDFEPAFRLFKGALGWIAPHFRLSPLLRLEAAETAISWEWVRSVA